jgi:hypothetical protein
MHLNAKCHEMTLMLKLLIISVNQLAPQNRVSDIIMHKTLRVISHKRLRTCDRYISVTLIGGKDGAGHKFASHYASGTNGVCECKMDVKVYVASNGSCLMVTWTVFQNHLLEVGLTQNQETMALRTLGTIGFLYFIMCEDPHE